jgi:hypothetical protein
MESLCLISFSFFFLLFFFFFGTTVRGGPWPSRGLITYKIFTVWGCWPHAQPPTLRTSTFRWGCLPYSKFPQFQGARYSPSLSLVCYIKGCIAQGVSLDVRVGFVSIADLMTVISWLS